MARTALVTGGTRGIGAAIARALKEAGHNVAATYAGNEEKAKAFRDETGIAVFKWDVTDPEACAEGVARVAGEVGPVDILVNNAGIARDGWFHKSDYEAWSAVIRTNLDSMFTMTRPVIEGMRERKWGRIVNIASVNGQRGQIGQVNYSTAKAGVIGFTKALALENARNRITVNCVCPGYIDTDMVASVPEKVLEGIVATIPLGRLGRADEIGSVVAYLASDAAEWMTGSVVSINGGQYMANG
ncbi:MAG TPA: acetoacetyl-CoA reductase [Afifellaceae bacterium]|nr:acetoacetyl-CoA reductase [Afifellaceae bacterium]